jgi:hypothetical protein
MDQEIFEKDVREKPDFKIGPTVSILIDGVKSSGWKVKKIFTEGPLTGKVMLEKEEKDVWGEKEIGIKTRKRIVDLESLEKWNRPVN